MKKIFCLLLTALLICTNICGCSEETTETVVKAPYVQIHVVYDANGNMIQQTLINESTGEYLLKEFTYVCDERGHWICTDQKTAVTAPSPICEHAGTRNIYNLTGLQTGPIVLLDNDEATVSIIKYLARDSWWEFGYELKVENKMNNVITIMLDCVSIMNIQCKPLFSIDHIDANNTAYFTMAWEKDTLDRSHIPYIDNVEFMIRIYDNEKWDTHALSGTQVLITHD